MPGRYIVNGVAYNSEQEARFALAKSESAGTLESAEINPTAPANFQEKAVAFARPLVQGLVTGAGTAIGGPGMGTLGGAAASIPIDYALQIAEGKAPSVTESLGQLGIQEGGGFIANKFYQAAKGALAAKAGIAPSVMDQTVYNKLRDLKGTFAQYTGSPVARFLEDIFASGTKSARLKEQGQLASNIGEETISNVTGRSPGQFTFKTPHAFGQVLQKDIQENFQKSLAESNFHGDVAASIANNNVTPVLAGGQLVNVSGKIDIPKSGIDALESELNSLSAPQVTPRQRDFANQIQQFLAKAKAGIVSFRDAWDFKKASDIYGYERGERGVEVTGARTISSELNDAIDAGIARWPNNTQTALQAWKNSKAIVGQREQTFGYKEAPNIFKIQRAKDTVIGKLDAALKDPNQLQRILNAGELTLPTGKVISTNARRDLQGYAFAKTLQDGWESQSTIDPNMGRFVPEKLLASWRDPAKQESLSKIYSNSQRENLSKILEAIIRIGAKQNTAGKIAADIRIGGAGVTLGAGLVTKGLEFLSGGGGGPYAAGVIGISLGLNVIGRVATNPTAARAFYNILNGDPLTVSQRFAAKMIFNTLQGADAVLEMRDGTKVPGKIVKGGRFEPLRTPE